MHIHGDRNIINDKYLGTNWFGLLFGLYSGCTMNSMCGNPVPKYAPSVWWCRDDFGLYTSIHLGQ